MLASILSRVYWISFARCTIEYVHEVGGQFQGGCFIHLYIFHSSYLWISQSINPTFFFLSICFSISASFFPAIYQSISFCSCHVSVNLFSISTYIYPAIFYNQSNYLLTTTYSINHSLNQSVNRSINLAIYLSIYVSIYLPIFLSVSSSIYPAID